MKGNYLMNDYNNKSIYVWKCTQPQFDNAYNQLIGWLNNYVDYLMRKVHFATSFGEVGSLQNKIEVYEKIIPDILTKIRYGLYDKFNKEIKKDFTIPIHIMDFQYMNKIKEIVTEFLDKIDCVYDFHYCSGMLYIKPKLEPSHRLTAYESDEIFGFCWLEEE